VVSCAKNGSSVLLIARDEEKLRDAAAILSPFGVEVQVLLADLSEMLAVGKTVADMLSTWPAIDGLVNNAGTDRFTPFTATTETELDWFLNLNVKAPYFLTQHLFGVLAARKVVVINISSYVSHRMLPGTPRRCKPSVQAGEAEGEAKRKGVVVRRGLKEAWSECAGRGTRTRYEA
jgi:short-subunit dehydrogenase